MRLVESFRHRYHAHKVAGELARVRAWQFKCVLRDIDTNLDPLIVLGSRVLGGNADIALRGFQCWILAEFLAKYPPVHRNENREVIDWLMFAVSGLQDQPQVRKFYQELCKHRDSAAGQVACVSVPVANYIVPEGNPDAWSIVTVLMPFFVLNTQMVIAKQFGDWPTFDDLQRRFDSLRDRYPGLYDTG
ncbi:MAG: hypothetical protein P4M04_16010 [Acidobacteriota bacterium]|nr:hypothetical protein [Acidobacteriota bacterium]